MKTLKKKVAIVFMMMSASASASIGVDKMMIFADKDGNATFNLTNTVDYRQFIQTGISELNVKDGKLESTPYTRSNIADWKLSVSPARTIITKQKTKSIGLKFAQKSKEDELIDHVFQLNVVPVPHLDVGEENKKTMQMSIGLAPYVIIPAKDDKPLKYELKREKDKIKFKNFGDTYIRANINACPEGRNGKKVEECMQTFYGLVGRDLEISLDENFATANELKIELSTHNKKFKDDFYIGLNKTKSKS